MWKCEISKKLMGASEVTLHCAVMWSAGLTTEAIDVCHFADILFAMTGTNSIHLKATSHRYASGAVTVFYKRITVFTSRTNSWNTICAPFLSSALERFKHPLVLRWKMDDKTLSNRKLIYVDWRDRPSPCPEGLQEWITWIQSADSRM